uniref:ABC transporter ATP-binding protein n=1 Tax=Candidatus Fimivicinus sp. TaxID=3056640 RepID=UPI003FEE5EFF
MIDVIDVTKKFGRFTAISDLSLTVHQASIYGLVGFNGAGKTTLLKTIAGIYRPEKGIVRVNAENIFDNAKMKQRLFYMPDELYFQVYATLKKMARFYESYYPCFSRKTFQELCNIFHLNQNEKINSFSKGMRRQAELVLCLSTRSDFLLLDESFDGLDPAKRSLAKKLLIEYVAERGASVIISSHNLHELEDLCDHVGLLDGQKLLLDCSVDDISASRCKFRVAFDREMDRTDFSGFTFKRFIKDGRLITFTAQGDIQEQEERLRAMNPILLESFPLSLEEIFMDEMEGEEYDYSDIFQ